MGKKHITKIVGKISDEVVNRYELYEYRDVDIIQSMGLFHHIQKHLEEFKSIDSFNLAMNSIPNILSNPRYVCYDRQKNSLLYYKELEENVCVVVKLNLSKKGPYVATVYPISENKILRNIEHSYIKKD